MSEQSFDLSRQMYERRQRRRDKVMLISLIELLTILTFVATAFALVSKQELDLSKNNAAYVAKLEARIRGLEEANRKLEQDNQRLRKENATLWEAYFGQPLPDDPVSRARMMGELQRRGFGVPLCSTPSGRLFLVYLNDRVDGVDSYSFIQGPWPVSEAGAVRLIPGVEELLGGESLTKDQVQAFASRVRAFGDAQRPACRYRILAQERHTNLALYKEQLSFLDKFFRTSRANEPVSAPTGTP